MLVQQFDGEICIATERRLLKLSMFFQFVAVAIFNNLGEIR